MGQASEWVTEHVPTAIEPQHRQKFIADVLTEIELLNPSRIGGLGITREEFDAWQKSARTQVT
jgi:hypothetical protein